MRKKKEKREYIIPDPPECMTELSLLGFPDHKNSLLKKKGINTICELLRYFPKRFKDYRRLRPLSGDGQCCVMAKMVRMSCGKSSFMDFITADCVTEDNIWIHVTWYYRKSAYAIERKVAPLKGRNVLIAGKAKYNPEYGNYSVVSPDLFDVPDPSLMKLYPDYPSIAQMTGMSEKYFCQMVKKALDDYMGLIPHTLPESFARSRDLPSHEDAYRCLHFPETASEYVNARKRLLYEDLWQFLLKMETERQEMSVTSSIRIKKTLLMEQMVTSLPYTMTDDQENTVRTIVDKMKKGIRVHDMIQGDVGCGKTIVAFLCMSVLAGNGYQSVLLAPTGVLAKQHYEDMKEKFGPLGIEPLYVPPVSSMKKKEKEELLRKISYGEALVMVGTHALLSDKIAYYNLGLIVTDEEHRFGVDQRSCLLKRGAEGIHYISMSATPIPRSMAEVSFGSFTVLHLITQMPPGRKPVTTGIADNMNKCMDFCQSQIAKKRQIYLVCAQISGQDDKKDEKGDGILSVDDAASVYRERFGNDAVRVLTGKTSARETEAIMDAFKKNEFPILAATMVIEVGVNVPNASTIIIHDADRFGLSTLHQLRGRVGRGGGDAYCILFSRKKDNERLDAMVRLSKGADIAEEDLHLRGAGDLLGTKQSGISYYTDLAIHHPDEYRELKEYLQSAKK